MATLLLLLPVLSLASDFVFTIQPSPDISSLVLSRAQGYLDQLAPARGLDLEAVEVLVGKQAETIITESELAVLGSEGYVVRGSCVNGSIQLAVRGNARVESPSGALLGNHYGLYALLQMVGVHFLHPLQPTLTPSLLLRATDLCAIDESSSPHWPVRIWHYHTQHPLELTDCLNGWDSTRGTSSFETMLPQVALFFEWLVANKQNSVEWVALAASSWPEGFADGEIRQMRFRTLTGMAHEFGLEAGLDVPIALQQQHSWYMVNSLQPLNKQLEAISLRLDWLFKATEGAGFDFLNTESGSTEFSHPNCSHMLAWMNHTANYARQTHNKTVYIKVHVSQGQACPDYIDPATGDPINFNFLPEFATRQLAVAAHTVQTYAFDDPAPTYGNTNFSFMLEWASEQAAVRDVLYYGETAYWVNFDIDVPLFLGALYADRRVRDLRLLKQREVRTPHSTFRGQVNFCSGWEWGYWVGDVVTARAAWSVLGYEDDGVTSHEQALRAALLPVAAAFDAAQGGDGCRTGVCLGAGAQVVEVLVSVASSQVNTLIYGNRSRGSSVVQRNGHGYLEGWDTDAELTAFAAHLLPSSPTTQPDRLPLPTLLPRDQLTNYSDVQPLLALMANDFANLSHWWSALAATALRADKDGLVLWRELDDSLAITALRATQVYATYEAANHVIVREARLADSLAAIQQAQLLVAKREQAYRVPVSRIAGWVPHDTKETPMVTTYQGAYLWTAHSLLYWWRDYARVKHPSLKSRSPCYLNIQDPADVGFGPGLLNLLTEYLVDQFGNDTAWELLVDCLSAPDQEIVLPRDL